VSAAKQLALMAGIPVKKKADGTEYIEVSKATGKYLFGPHASYEAPLLCSCIQRDYPHELAIHHQLRQESFNPKLKYRWPWSLNLSKREEPSTERSAA
jgi:hypothetical protein